MTAQHPVLDVNRDPYGNAFPYAETLQHDEQAEADNIASFTALLFACFGVGIIVGVIAAILIHTVL